MLQKPEPVLVIACGAIARELQQLKRLNGWEHMTLQAIDATLHFRPHLITQAVAEKIEQAQGRFRSIFVAYADCGTYGALDRLIEQHGVERLRGLHCYATFAGQQQFEQFQDAEPGTFYLTDFLVQQFDRLVVKALKMDSHPELTEAYFGNYTRLIYLAQTHNPVLQQEAEKIAGFLTLDYQYVFTGYGELGPALKQFVATRALHQARGAAMNGSI